MDSQRNQTGKAAPLFAEAVAIMERLRAPGGCPWDREQSFASIQPYTLEETYEVFDAIDRRHWPDLCEELGDLLLQVLFYAEMASEAGHFGIAEVIASLNAKLIRRHPHVFPQAGASPAGRLEEAPADAIDSAQVLRNWEAIKQEEKANRSPSDAKQPEGQVSALDGILRSLPALLEARKLGSRAHRNGFDWPDTEGLFDKLREETAELREAIEQKRVGEAEPEDEAKDGLAAESVLSEAVAAEVGDLLFTTVNLARHLKVDPEFALRKTNARFRRRFAAMERMSAVSLKSLPAAELEHLWTQAKAQERGGTKLEERSGIKAEGRSEEDAERRSGLPIAP